MKREFHQQAEAVRSKIVQDFQSRLTQLSEQIADRESAEIVLTSHVKKASDFITRSTDSENKLKSGIHLIGATFFGASVSGFITAALEQQLGFITLFTLLGLVGIFLALWGLWK